MYGSSYVWHGLALNDLADLEYSLLLYFVWTALAYTLLGALLTFLVHQAILHEWVSLKRAFPVSCMLLGGVAGVAVYGVIHLSGLSFADADAVHLVVDLTWQVVEQAIGGLMVAIGLIYDMHRTFMETEQAQ